ncbi:hypothetical protein CONLIGDRAFT_153868 [Coniochaeta ligniaria NRRL 30616]|uniref:Zn(2)-C6 fungal-type domain-containing protein n=1 Tax=Coniochaeta ligniaria NRRL 30616 TaxID=1408157 RepID=A0A1J7J0A6_9PEZI|nr:hypothetical protein CONLIGDRAFT_153868 [Coniochaeta ligniaria NRRL 30616]
MKPGNVERVPLWLPEIQTDMDRETVFRPHMVSNRARHACTRCKRQKLKCDNQRPCYLCVRSRMECRDEDRMNPKSQVKSRRGDLSRLSKSTAASAASAPDTAVETASSPSLALSNSRPSGSRTYVERTSTLRVVQQVYSAHSGSPTETRQLDAIPDSPAANGSSTDCLEDAVPISDLIGMDLPPRTITTCLLDTFSESVGWYLSLFHEQTLRVRLQRIIEAGRARPDDTTFLMLVLIILATGARYVTDQQKQSYKVEFHTSTLQNQLIVAIEHKLLVALDEATTTSVTLLNLLASHYLFNRKTRRAFTIMAAAVRVAQAMELHNESAWGEINPIEREVRRRLWWTLYTSDRFIAQVFGRPAIIHDTDIHVSYPDMDDETTTSEYSGSEEMFANGVRKPVSSGSYHRYKAKLYEIATPITRGMYSRDDGAMIGTMEQIKTVHQQLLEWEQNLPAELRLRSFEGTQFQYTKASLSSTLHLQALALQVSYDNVQLLLHRPLLSLKDVDRQGPEFSSATGDKGPRSGVSREKTEDVIAVSRHQCWASALRMSYLVKHQGALEFAKNTPFGAHVGLHCFTAGVTLAIFALSRPFSSQAQEAKQGVGRLIRIPTSSQSWSAVFNQGAEVLKDLLRLIVEKELQALVEPGDQTDERQARLVSRDTSRNNGSHAEAHYTSNTAGDGDAQWRPPQSFTLQTSTSTPGQTYHQKDTMSPATQSLSTTLNGFGDCSISTANNDFDGALLSLQDVLSGNANSSIFDMEYVDWSATGDPPFDGPSPYQFHFR